MYKLFVLAAVLATATAEGFYPAGYAGFGGLYGHGLGGLYGGYPGYGAYGYAGLGGYHHGLGLAAPLAAPIAAAPLVAAPATYAVPAPRVLQEAPIVEQVVEPVEQWGYKVKY